MFPLYTVAKGGVAITYRDGNAEFGAIGSFTPYNELNDILHRVKNHKSFVSIEKIVITSFAYHYTDRLHEDYSIKPRAAVCMGADGRPCAFLRNGREK